MIQQHYHIQVPSKFHHHRSRIQIPQFSGPGLKPGPSSTNFDEKTSIFGPGPVGSQVQPEPFTDINLLLLPVIQLNH